MAGCPNPSANEGSLFGFEHTHGLSTAQHGISEHISRVTSSGPGSHITLDSDVVESALGSSSSTQAGSMSHSYI